MSLEDDDLLDNDSKLFRRVVDGAKPLAGKQRAADERPRPRPMARFRRADDEEVMRELLEADFDEMATSSGEALRFARPSVGRRTMRKLARGGFSIQAEIDLHGMTADQARDALREFLVFAGQNGFTCIRVVHGKGLGSGQRGPVLKRKVNAWLRRWDEVLAFTSTPRVHGGTGAVNVLLRQR